MAAGWYVARGRGISDRAETTVALTAEAVRHQGIESYALLGADWLARWNRSGAKIPVSVQAHEQAAFEGAILGHPQFKGLDLHG